MTGKPKIDEEKIEKLKNIRSSRTDISITPPRPHLVDVSVVQSESVFNFISYILTILGSLFIGIYHKPEGQIELYECFFWGILGLGLLLYMIGKLYLYKKMTEEKISLDEYFGEE